MKKRILVICDKEAEYACRLADFFEQRKELPFEVRVFSDTEELCAFCGKNEVETVLISESAYCKEVAALAGPKIIILRESGNLLKTEYSAVDKYQSSENILKEVMCYYTVEGKESNDALTAQGTAGLIGLYSPVRRNLQTTFALALGQILAKKNRVLYLNFESYSGFENILKRQFRTELTDLLYYIKHTEGKLLYRVESMVEKVGNLDIVPPVFSVVDMQMITGGDWKELIGRLEERCNYDYIILDLSDNMRGLFEVLKMCGKIYTLIREDVFAKAKLEQYETLLKTTGYEEVFDKSEWLLLPQFANLPAEMDRLPGSELGEYICRTLNR